MDRIARLILDHPTAILAALVGLTLFFGAAARESQVDSSVESMLPADAPDVVFLRGMKQRFGSDEVVIIAFTAPRLFAPPALETVRRISQDLHEIALEGDGDAEDAILLIDRVVSLADVDQIRGARGEDGGSTFEVASFLSRIPETREEQRRLWSRAVSDPLFVPNFLARPETDDPDAPLTTLILARIVDRPGDLAYRNQIRDRVEAILAAELGGAARIETFHLAGVPILKATLATLAEDALATLTPLIYLVIVAILFLIFRSVRAMILPSVTIALAVVWTVGLLTLCGSRLNVASAVIVALVRVIGAATAIYFFSEYYDTARTLRDGREIVHRALSSVLLPSFLACLTTAIGFLALATSPILLIREMGLYAAFGVTAVWLIAVTLIPTILLRMPPPPEGRRGAAASPFLMAQADRLGALVERFRWPILAGGALLLSLAAVQIATIRTTTDFVGFLRADHPVARAYRFAEREIGGITPYDIWVRSAPGALLEPELLQRIDRLQDWLEQQPEVDHTFSVVDYLKRMNQAMHDDDPRFFTLAETREQVASYLLLYEDPVESRLAPWLYPGWQDVEEARILVRARSLDTDQIDDFVARCNDFLESQLVGERGPLHELAAGEVEARVTGTTQLNAVVAGGLVDGQIRSLFVAFAGIWITVTLLLRSVAGGVLAMIPNVFPIVMMLGVMGYARIPLDIATATISAIAIGIGVDDTIHFLARYRRRRAELGSERPAIRAALREVGRPMVFTSAVLTCGFWVLCFSGFVPHVHFGILAGVTMLMALLGDLILLPALIFVFKPRLPDARGARVRPRS